MKIEVDEHGTIVLKKVFNPLKLVTNDNEILLITMRDSGFEAQYAGKFYQLKEGNVIKQKREDLIEKLSIEVRYSLIEIKELQMIGELNDNDTIKIVKAAHDSNHQNLQYLKDVLSRGFKFC